MKKRIITWVVILIVLFGGAGSAYYFLMPAEPEPIVENIVKKPTVNIDALLAKQEKGLYEDENKLIVKTGNVSVTRTDGTEDEVATETTVSTGDQIVVQGGSSAEIQWFDGSITRLAGGTDIRIEEASYDPEDKSKTTIQIFANVGTIWSKVVNIIDDESEYSILSASAIAGVRGSTFNYILEEDGEPLVESIEHSAFLAKLVPSKTEGREENNQYEEIKTIVKGQQASLTEEKEIEVHQIAEEKLDDEWHADNLTEDERAEKKLKEKNLERIAELAGPLPGDPDYESKNEAIQKLLDSIENPMEKVQIESQIDGIRIYEAVALMNNADNLIKTAEGIKETKEEQIDEMHALGLILMSNVHKQMGDIGQIKTLLTEGDPIERRRNMMQIKLKLMARNLGGVLADEENLYEMKEIIREMHIELEDDPEAKEFAEKKAMESKLFELTDLAEKDGVDPLLLEEVMHEYEEELEAMKESLEESEEYKELFHQMLDSMSDKPVDITIIDEMKDEFDRPEEAPEIPKEEPAPEPIREPEPTPTSEPKETIIEEAPFHQGESVHESRESRETIIDEAPFHQGESPL